MFGTVVKVIAPPAVVAANGNTTGVDVGNFHGLCLIALSAVGTVGTVTSSLQHSDDNATNWTDVENSAFTAVGVATSEQSITFNADRLKKYVRVKDVITASGSATRVVSIVGNKQYYP